MKTTRMILTVGAVLSAMVMVGCSHTVDIIVHNTSSSALMVKAMGPGIGVERVGLAAPASTFKGEVTLDNDVLPANLVISVGKLPPKACKVTKNTERIILRISLDGTTLLRMGDDPITEEINIDTRTPIGGSETVID